MKAHPSIVAVTLTTTFARRATMFREAADRAGDKIGDAAETAKDGAESVGHKVSDAIEDVIPGDSDRDGH